VVLLDTDFLSRGLREEGTLILFRLNGTRLVPYFILSQLATPNRQKIQMRLHMSSETSSEMKHTCLLLYCQNFLFKTYKVRRNV